MKNPQKIPEEPQDKTQVFEDELGLPKLLDLLTSQARYKASFDDNRLLRWPPEIQRAKLHPVSGYPDNLVKFHYEVAEATNVSGWTVPARFHFMTFDLSPTGKREPRVGGVGKLLAARETTRPASVFMPDKQQTIIDYRFRHETKLVDGISYKATANATSPPSTNEPALRAAFDRVVRHPPLDLASGAAPRRPWFLAVLLVSVAVLPVLVVWFNLKRKRRTKMLS